MIARNLRYLQTRFTLPIAIATKILLTRLTLDSSDCSLAEPSKEAFSRRLNSLQAGILMKNYLSIRTERKSTEMIIFKSRRTCTYSLVNRDKLKHETRDSGNYYC